MSTIAEKVEFTVDEMNGYAHYRKHGLHHGYFLRYFEFLKGSKTNKEAFCRANNEYFNLFRVWRYKDVRCFRKGLSLYLNIKEKVFN